MTAGKTIELDHLIEGSRMRLYWYSNSLGTTLEMWRDQAPALRERFRLVRYDHRGHGGSPSRPAPTPWRTSARMCWFCWMASGWSASFCGLSIGDGRHVARQRSARTRRAWRCAAQRPASILTPIARA